MAMGLSFSSKEGLGLGLGWAYCFSVEDGYLCIKLPGMGFLGMRCLFLYGGFNNAMGALAREMVRARGSLRTEERIQSMYGLLLELVKVQAPERGREGQITLTIPHTLATKPSAPYNIEGRGQASTFSSSVVQQKRTADGCAKKRDNDLHRLLFMPNGLPDGTELAYYGKGQRILGGYKQGKGIVCSCCDTEISPSQFEAHAGWSARRQPYRNIYTSNGLALHDIALSLASGQNLATGRRNDVCAVCGNVGDLIICQGCPQAFHAGSTFAFGQLCCFCHCYG
ncbi:acyl-CoA N-acyltransferase with RING/FYVE/PHD-type zinc finger domain-containing protein [Actinidia rufa]|uniref:Acyl-CoA N-acyltransferase with RING/FYVE/PHD-type zinc finger domain-containing protein n=1 Tax=Actinidia rufa TaxID=165716 RepID=A0A7J0GJN7_9ERIC|nr:acyl-CoA N-acyltransferase with RING/FYVE/PHD-type zinc finger domain-containing protein [Actinidia rufa]